MRPDTIGPGVFSRTSIDIVRVGGVAADDCQRARCEPGAPRSARMPSKTDMSRVGLPSIART